MRVASSRQGSRCDEVRGLADLWSYPTRLVRTITFGCVTFNRLGSTRLTRQCATIRLGVYRLPLLSLPIIHILTRSTTSPPTAPPLRMNIYDPPSSRLCPEIITTSSVPCPPFSLTGAFLVLFAVSFSGSTFQMVQYIRVSPRRSFQIRKASLAVIVRWKEAADSMLLLTCFFTCIRACFLTSCFIRSDRPRLYVIVVMIRFFGEQGKAKKVGE